MDQLKNRVSFQMNTKLMKLVVLIICSTSFCVGETVEFAQSQKDSPSFFVRFRPF